MVEATKATPTRDRSKQRRRFLFTALALLLALLVIEFSSFVILRLCATQADVYFSETALFDAHRNHRLNPDFRLSTSDAKRRLHSRDGFRRDQAVSVTKPPRTIRIIALGTSALYGIGAYGAYPTHPPLSNDETITGVLEQLINRQLATGESGYRVEVINAGVSAYQTFHELIYLNTDLLTYAPDIVINIDGHNDFYRVEPSDRWAQYAYSTSILVDQYNGRSFFLPWVTAVRSVSPYSNFFNLLEKANKRIWYLTKVEKPLPNTPHREIPALGDFAENIRAIARRGFLRDLWQIHNLGKRESYDHCVFLQPEVVLESAAALTETDRNIQRITLDLLDAGDAEKMRRVRELLPDLFEREGIPFHDVAELAPYNPGKEDLYIDYCHLSPAGARVVAGRIEKILFPLLTARIALAEASNASGHLQ
jgi:lysophospholipase L1-like esterase